MYYVQHSKTCLCQNLIWNAHVVWTHINPQYYDCWEKFADDSTSEVHEVSEKPDESEQQAETFA